MACSVLGEEPPIKEASTFQNSCSQSSKDHKRVILQSIVEPAPGPVHDRRIFCYWQKGSLNKHIIHFYCLSIASYVGVLCRIYLSKLSRWDGVPFFSSLYAQVFGTMIMGFVTSHGLLLAENHSFVYQAITTGLCGSITTFSSWNLEAVSSLLQTHQETPNNITRIVSWGTTLLLGLGMSIGALNVGKHMAFLSPWSDHQVRKQNSTESAAEDSTAIDASTNCCSSKCCSSKCCISKVCMNLIAGSLWLLASVLIVVVPLFLPHGRYDIAFSALLAALGTYCRWHLAPLNATFHNFKLGTFLANITGALLLAGVVSAKSNYPEGWEHDIFVGIGTGFCGCLTTVSTFVVELSTLPLKYAYIYGLTSILLAQAGQVLIQGPVQWIQ